MKHLLLTAALALAAAAPAHAAPGSVALLECERALDPAARSAVFEGRMDARPDAPRMQMRFTLQTRRTDQPSWAPIEAEGWDEWITADPGVARFVYTREVAGMWAPASYRTVVRFRWTDTDGRVVARRRVASRPCRQPDLRPDLVVVAVRRDGDVYRLRVRNTGRTAATGFDVAVEADDGALVTHRVRRLRARRTKTVRIAAPRCTGQVSAIADPAALLDERDERNNTLTRACS